MSLMTITAEYDSMDVIRNTREDLIGSGIEQEHIYIDIIQPDFTNPNNN